MEAIEQSVQLLDGVGAVMAKKLERLGIETVRDLLFYYPRDWEDFSNPASIKGLKIDEDVIIKAKIAQIKQSRTFRKRMSIVEALLVDDSGEIRAVWFNQHFIAKILKPGQEWIFAGKVGYDFRSGTKNIVITQYEKNPVILPVYAETEGLTSKYLRKIIQPLLNRINVLVQEYLPDELISDEKLIGLGEALRKIHNPENTEDIKLAKKRLAFDELFMIVLRMLSRRRELQREEAPAIIIDKELLQEFVKNLPFDLTLAQKRAAWQIIQDLEKKLPMNRLLDGDVGSGKTVVGAMVVLVLAKNNYQTVWLAPTEILANQHFKNIEKLLSPFDLKVGLLTAANKKADLAKDDLIIGTHALLQENISVNRLGLVIVDEQHRFGVKQRAYLRQNSKLIPHLLSMTATPIPRSLALSIYGDLDVSVIDELPPGRQKVKTYVIKPENRAKAYEFIRKEIESGRQAFVICPLIDESKNKASDKLFDLDKKSVVTEYEKLSKEIFPNFKVGILHGRLKGVEKDRVMKDFSAGKLNLIVSTAVVEVGIDIPNATVMMIEGAEKFGLAQLHQFRGRVGRGRYQSYCFLFSEGWNENTKERLKAMVTCDNGFELAQKDLEIRGPGELIGLRQSGLPDLKMASLQDIILIKNARKAAEKILDEGLNKYPKLSDKLAEFEKQTHLE